MHMETCIRKYAKTLILSVVKFATSFFNFAHSFSALFSKTAKRCPLCHKDVEGGEEGWTRHLMGAPSELCPGHPRLKHSRPTLPTRLPGNSHNCAQVFVGWVAVISAKNHKRQRRKRQSVTTN